MSGVARGSHGSGRWTVDAFAAFGEGSHLEADVLVFHPERVSIGERVYVGHRAILKGYHEHELVIGDGSWVGEQTYINAAGGVRIGRHVGIGPGVTIISSVHAEEGRGVPILQARLEFAPVVVEDDADLGVGSILLPGVTVGRGAQVGAGAVATTDVAPYTVVAGVPARVLRERPG